MSMREMFAVSKDIVDGLTYKLFCVSLFYIHDIADDTIDHLQPKEKITKKQIQAFFEKRIQ